MQINQELQDLCLKNNVDVTLLQDLIKAEKSNLSSNRWSGYKTSLEGIIRKYI